MQDNLHTHLALVTNTVRVSFVSPINRNNNPKIQSTELNELKNGNSPVALRRRSSALNAALLSEQLPPSRRQSYAAFEEPLPPQQQQQQVAAAQNNANQFAAFTNVINSPQVASLFSSTETLLRNLLGQLTTMASDAMSGRSSRRAPQWYRSTLGN
jgi:hypothetical protein